MEGEPNRASDAHFRHGMMVTPLEAVWPSIAHLVEAAVCRFQEFGSEMVHAIEYSKSLE